MALAALNAFDVAIIGAGFAGLSTGAALAERGARVLVLEARSRLGGRATAFVDRETGERVDNGQHILLGCYHETLAFLDRVDARRFVRAQAQLKVTMVDTAGTETDFEYTPQGWLKKVTRGANPTFDSAIVEWEYDAIGRKKTETTRLDTGEGDDRIINWAYNDALRTTTMTLPDVDGVGGDDAPV